MSHDHWQDRNVVGKNNMIRYTYQDILGNSSQEFPRISTNFVDIFSGYSAELVARNSWNWLQKIP